MLQTPQHVLGAIAAETKVQCLSGGIVFIPHGFTAGLESMSDGVADQQEVHVFHLCFHPQFLFVAGHPPTFGPLGRLDVWDDGQNGFGGLLGDHGSRHQEDK